jgi:hypothetical protein
LYLTGLNVANPGKTNRIGNMTEPTPAGFLHTDYDGTVDSENQSDFLDNLANHIFPDPPTSDTETPQQVPHKHRGALRSHCESSPRVSPARGRQ